MSFSEKTILFGDWLPDQAAFSNHGCLTAENVIPLTKTTYGAMPSWVAASPTPLNGSPLGAFSATDASGNPGNYVGTTTKLYRATNATKPNFVDASGAAYAVPTGGFWSFTEGAGVVYASNGTDPIQSVATAAPSNFAPLGANAPRAKVLAVVQPGFLLCGDINDVTVGIQPQGVRWSALGDFTDFPLVGSADAIAKESDWQEVLGPHGRLKAIASNLASCNAALFFEHGIFRMLYTGDAKIFDIQPVEKARGTPAARSVVQVGQIAYFLGHDGWYSFDGTLAHPIGVDKINKSFFADCDPNYIERVEGVVDPASGLCFWPYAGAGNTNGVPNKILCFNPFVSRFTIITDFVGSGLFVARHFGTSLDDIDALGYNLDNLPFSLDSPILTGIGFGLAAFSNANVFGYFSGPNMPFVLEGADVQLTPGRRSRTNSLRPLTDGEGASIRMRLAVRQVLADSVVWQGGAPPNSDGVWYVTRDGRYHRFQVSALRGHTSNHIQGLIVSFKPSGRR